MGAFDDFNKAGQQFAEDVMGETFSHTSKAGTVTSGLVGVFNQVTQDYVMQDFSTRKDTAYTVISGKVQWGSVVPADRETITDSSAVAYQIHHISGILSAGEPAYELTLKKLT